MGINDPNRLRMERAEDAECDKAGDPGSQHEASYPGACRKHAHLLAWCRRIRRSGRLRQPRALKLIVWIFCIKPANDVRRQIVGKVAAQRHAAVEQQTAFLAAIDLRDDGLLFAGDTVQCLPRVASISRLDWAALPCSACHRVASASRFALLAALSGWPSSTRASSSMAGRAASISPCAIRR